MLPRGKTSDTLARFVAGFKSARERAAKAQKGRGG
jgi:indolepyruvate decarboxylase